MRRYLILSLIISLVVTALSLLSAGCSSGSGDQRAFSNDHRVFLPVIASSERPAERYTFFVAGHTYGVPEVNNPGVHPPFKAMFPQINSLHPVFGVFTGDIVIKSTPTDWDEVDADLAELTAPVHFAVGNHDMTNRDLFVSRYGPTYYAFEYQGDLFIVLDGELNQGNIVGEQMGVLRDMIQGNRWQNVFVFVHRLLWVTEGTPYYILRDRINNSSVYTFQNNFWEDVEPLLRGLDAQVYVVAGDVGVTWAMALFYEEYENMHLIASGMGGSEEENFLVFDVDAADVRIQAQRLDGQPLNRGVIEAYNLAYYSSVP